MSRPRQKTSQLKIINDQEVGTEIPNATRKRRLKLTTLLLYVRQFSFNYYEVGL